MLKKILTLSATLLITSSAMCMEPYFSAPQPEMEWLYLSQGWIQYSCPCCNELRLFPSMEFIIALREKLTEQEQLKMVQAITNYTGDIVPGRLCPFCGRNLPKLEDFE